MTLLGNRNGYIFILNSLVKVCLTTSCGWLEIFMFQDLIFKREILSLYLLPTYPYTYWVFFFFPVWWFVWWSGNMLFFTYNFKWSIWWSLTIGILLQWVLSPKYFNFPLPITLTMIHMGFSGLVAFILVRVFKVSILKFFNAFTSGYYFSHLKISFPTLLVSHKFYMYKTRYL